MTARLDSNAHSRGGVVRTEEGSWRIAGTRVSLDSIVHSYKQGHAPELIAAEFPSLSLEQVRGAIAFYLSKQGEVDQYLEQQEARWEQFRESKSKSTRSAPATAARSTDFGS